MSSKSIYRFYVYAYLRSKDSTTGKAGTPYYIGKGSGKRAWKNHGNLQIPPNKNNIVILERNLSEIGAYAIERQMIAWYGKKIDGGILHNICDGGTGSPGIKWTDDHKKNHSENIKGKNFYHNLKTKKEIRLRDDEPVPEGFVHGRSQAVGIENTRFGTKMSINFLTGEKTVIGNEEDQPLWCGTSGAKYAFIYKNTVTFSSKTIPKYHPEFNEEVMRCTKRAFVKFGQMFYVTDISHSFIQKDIRPFFQQFNNYGDIGLKIVPIKQFFSENMHLETYQWIG